jgi:hypothetical protein
MSIIRIKTKEEFIRDCLWNYEYETPLHWNIRKLMNPLIGQLIDDTIEYDIRFGGFRYKGWFMPPSNITCD